MSRTSRPIVFAAVDEHGRSQRDAAKVLGIGELLWDLFPDGPRVGGAPFNVVANLRRLGHPAAFVTAVGADSLGRDALAAAVDRGIDPRFIAVVPDLPTGTVTVTPEPIAGHRFQVVSPVAYEAIPASQDVAGRIRRWGADALVFGTLAQRNEPVRALTRWVARGGPAARLYDVNLREGTWDEDLVRDLLSLATLVKVNDDEAAIVATLLDCGPEPADLGGWLFREYGVGTLCITRGASGAALWVGGEVHEVPGIPVDVADTVGAGDAFAAGLLHGLLADVPPAASLAFANRLGALVASRPGALPEWTVDEVA
jgi:fructokinase